MHQICPTNDSELLRAFAVRNDHAAFAQLVDRHARWIFAASLRQLHEHHLAEDAVQIVFILLAQKASKMSTRQKVTGWLFNTLQFTVKDLRRASARRTMHEQRSARDSSAPTEKSILELAEILDPAVAKLPESYRVPILLRFYQGMGFDEIASGLSISEVAARKRVDRALGLLRIQIGAKADESLISASALCGCDQAAKSLNASTANAVLTAHAGGTLSGGTAAAVKGVSFLITISKIQTAALLILAAFILAPAGVYLAGINRNHPPAPVAATISPAAVEPLPTTFPDDDAYTLVPGQAVKLITNTGQQARLDLLRPVAQSAGLDLNHPPVAIIVAIKNGQPQNWTWNFQKPYRLFELFENLLDTYPQRTEGDSTAAAIAGDFLYDPEASVEQRRAALQQLLRDRLHQSLTLTYRDVPRKVIVLDGTWNFNPVTPPRPLGGDLCTIELYEHQIAKHPDATSMCDQHTFANQLGEFVDEQVVIDARKLPAQFVCCMNGPPDQPHELAAVLDHVTEQTGLTWSEETRTVTRLFVERGK